MDVAQTGSPTLVLPLEDPSQIGHARRTALQSAQRLGFDEADAGRVALVATELSSNVLKHASRGALHLQVIPGRDGPGLEIIAVDRGPGFDVAACLVDGYSSRGTQGIGLGALVRQAQVFDAHADARGAVVMARVYPRMRTRPQDCRFGVSHHALHGEPDSGDAWRLAIDGSRVSAMVLDGLGHGVAAAEAARAGAEAFEQDPFGAPEATLSRAHARMVSTRGGAAALCQYDGSGSIRFLGIGNIAGSLVGAEESRGLASHPGIVGGQFRKPTVFAYPALAGQLLIMHSDGLQARWRLADYPGLWRRHPGVVATVLYRDYCRGRDDTTVLVISLENPRD